MFGVFSHVVEIQRRESSEVKDVEGDKKIFLITIIHGLPIGLL